MTETYEYMCSGCARPATLLRPTDKHACSCGSTNVVLVDSSIRPAEGKVLYLDYTNWRGERAWRRVVPLDRAPVFVTTPHHKEPVWTLRVYDLDRRAERSYVLKNIHHIRTNLPEGV